jgi:hypothetical protein
MTRSHLVDEISAGVELWNISVRQTETSVVLEWIGPLKGRDWPECHDLR